MFLLQSPGLISGDCFLEKKTYHKKPGRINNIVNKQGFLECIVCN